MLRNLLRENSQISNKDDLLNSLNERSERSKATKMWNDTLIKRLFTMTAFGRGANEQDFPLQLAAVVKNVPVTAIPYLAEAGWQNYLALTKACIELNDLNFRLNSQCKRRLTWSPKRVDSTNQ